MQLVINDHRKIHAIQEEFNQLFPYLKIEFFSKDSGANSKYSEKVIKHPDKTLGECRLIHDKGSLTVTPQMTVAQLVQNFSDVYGLTVKIFRQSGKAWLETTVTDNWSLEDQNRQGQELSN